MRIIFLIVTFLLLMRGSTAHPHLFVDCSLGLCFDDEGISGIEEHWIFDEMFSASIIDEYDKDKDGCFNEQESMALKKGAFDNLKGFDYFTFIKSDGKSITIQTAKQFKAKILNGKLIYHFTVPCQISVECKDKKIRIAMFDTSYFTAMTTANTLQGLEDSSTLESTVSFHQNKKYICFEDSGFPEFFILKIRKKE